MPTVNEMFPGRFLRARDLRGPVDVTIERVVQEEMYSISERAERKKWVVYFRKARKGLVLNITNAQAIAEIAGSEASEDWIGKRIVLYPAAVKVAGQPTLAVRVRRAEDED